jgi:hypothetical protein
MVVSKNRRGKGWEKHTKSGSCEPMATRRLAAALCQSTSNSCFPEDINLINKIDIGRSTGETTNHKSTKKLRQHKV